MIGEGEVVFQTSGEIECGNLQIHETPVGVFTVAGRMVKALATEAQPAGTYTVT